MGGVWEKVKGFDLFDLVFLEEKFNVAGLGRRVAREVDNLLGGDLEESIDQLFVTAGARRVENNRLIRIDIR